MSQFNELLDGYKAEIKNVHGIHDADEALLEKVTKGLGPSIYKADAELVSCSDKSELETVKKNFLIGKLGLKDSAELDAALHSVCEQMKDSKRKKRAIFYYLLVKKLGKESHYA